MADTVANICSTHLRYHRWAAHQLLALVEGLPPEILHADRKTSFGNIFDTLVHIFKADSVWFSRLAEDGSLQLSTVERPADLNSLHREWTTLLDRFNAWAEQLGEEEWGRPVTYASSQGVRFSTPVWQVVLHVVNHGTAYRGQATGILRQAGIAPPGTDLISFYRWEEM